MSDLSSRASQKKWLDKNFNVIIERYWNGRQEHNQHGTIALSENKTLSFLPEDMYDALSSKISPDFLRRMKRCHSPAIPVLIFHRTGESFYCIDSKSFKPKTLVCDFCSSTPIATSFHARPFSIGPIRYASAWAACAPCAKLIEVGDRGGLLKRFAVRAKGDPLLIAGAELIHSLFFENFISGRPISMRLNLSKSIVRPKRRKIHRSLPRLHRKQKPRLSFVLPSQKTAPLPGRHYRKAAFKTKTRVPKVKEKPVRLFNLAQDQEQWIHANLNMLYNLALGRNVPGAVFVQDSPKGPQSEFKTLAALSKAGVPLNVLKFVEKCKMPKLAIIVKTGKGMKFHCVNI